MRRSPNIFLTSSIHVPVLGINLIEVEKVPMRRSGTLMPIPKENIIRKPRRRFPICATKVRRNARPGVKHGEATVPLAKPKKKADKSEPEGLMFVCCLLINEGSFISYNPNIESAK